LGINCWSVRCHDACMLTQLLHHIWNCMSQWNCHLIVYSAYWFHICELFHEYLVFGLSFLCAGFSLCFSIVSNLFWCPVYVQQIWNSAHYVLYVSCVLWILF
jgi:hypothetical protein